MSDEDKTETNTKNTSTPTESKTVVKFPDKFKPKSPLTEEESKTEDQEEEEHRKNIKNQLTSAATENFSEAIVLAVHTDGSLYTSCSNMDPLFFLGLIETCKHIMIKASMQPED